jgi:hypothetical protein
METSKLQSPEIAVFCSHPCVHSSWFLVEFRVSSPKMFTFSGPQSCAAYRMKVWTKNCIQCFVHSDAINHATALRLQSLVPVKPRSFLCEKPNMCQVQLPSQLHERLMVYHAHTFCSFVLRLNGFLLSSRGRLAAAASAACNVTDAAATDSTGLGSTAATVFLFCTNLASMSDCPFGDRYACTHPVALWW